MITLLLLATHSRGFFKQDELQIKVYLNVYVYIFRIYEFKCQHKFHLTEKTEYFIPRKIDNFMVIHVY